MGCGDGGDGGEDADPATPTSTEAAVTLPCGAAARTEPPAFFPVLAITVTAPSGHLSPPSSPESSAGPMSRPLSTPWGEGPPTPASPQQQRGRRGSPCRPHSRRGSPAPDRAGRRRPSTVSFDLERVPLLTPAPRDDAVPCGWLLPPGAAPQRLTHPHPSSRSDAGSRRTWRTHRSCDAASTVATALPFRQAAPDEEGYVSDRRELLKAYANTLCLMTGAGTLHLPYVFAEGGWATLALVALMGHMALFSGKLLVRCLHGQAGYAGGRVPSFPELGRLALGRGGWAVAHAAQKLTIVGVASCVLILLGIFAHRWWPGVGQNTWTLLISAVLLPTAVLLPDVSSLGAFSAAGVVALVALLAAVAAAAARGGDPSAEGAGAGHELPTEGGGKWELVRWGGLPAAFAGAALGFGGHANFPSIEEPLQHRGPEAYCRVLDWAFATLLVAYVAIGAAGYAAYGGDVRSPVIASLPSGPLLSAAEVTLAANLLAAYPVLLHALFGEAEAALGIAACADAADGGGAESPRTAATERGGGGGGGEGCALPAAPTRVACRAGICLGTVAVAYSVPRFADVLSLVGAAGVCTTAYVLPPLIHARLRGGECGRGARMYSSVICAAGVAGGGVGAAAALRALASPLPPIGA